LLPSVKEPEAMDVETGATLEAELSAQASTNASMDGSTSFSEGMSWPTSIQESLSLRVQQPLQQLRRAKCMGASINEAHMPLYKQFCCG
jgi:hypothetical protein